MLGYTVLMIDNTAQHHFTILRGTVVYLNSQFVALDSDTVVNIEERGNTNYDNQRRCTDDNGLHLFWIKAPGICD